MSFTPTAESLALAVDECLYGRDVVPLSPAVREANLRNQVAPRDFPPEADKPVVLHKNSHKKAPRTLCWWSFWKNLILELQIKIPPCLEGLNLFCGKLTPVAGVCQGNNARNARKRGHKVKGKGEGKR